MKDFFPPLIVEIFRYLMLLINLFFAWNFRRIMLFPYFQPTSSLEIIFLYSLFYFIPEKSFFNVLNVYAICVHGEKKTLTLIHLLSLHYNINSIFRIDISATTAAAAAWTSSNNKRKTFLHIPPIENGIRKKI